MFDLQGHRGVRALKPENTLPSFEVALDLGLTTIETDVHLTRDGVPILIHDPRLFDSFCTPVEGRWSSTMLVSELRLADLRGIKADRLASRQLFPKQEASVTPLARVFAERAGMDPYSPPSVAELLAFVMAYAGDLGEAVGKSEHQRGQAQRMRLDLELKRVPFYPECMGDRFDGDHPGQLEERVVSIIREHGFLERTIVRSFDHRSVRAVRILEPRLTTAVLLGHVCPVSAAEVAKRAGASICCPDYRFVDERMVRETQAQGIAVVPWTVNERADVERLLDWGVDGFTTDDPTPLFELLQARGLWKSSAC